MVRCARCGTRWLARVFDEDPYATAGLPQLGGRGDIADAVVIEEIAPVTAPRRLPPPPPSRLPPRWRSAPVHRRMKALGIVFGVLAAAAVLRAPIVAALPELKPLPAAVGLLEFERIRSETVQLGGTATLFVEGEIVNRSLDHVDLPAIRITLKSPQGGTVTSWLVEPSATGLAAGRSIGFRSALASPPVDATQVTLSLARRQGQTIGPR